MIYLREKDYQKIVEYGRQGLPDEVCGLLGGRIRGEEKYVERVYCLTNTDASPEHFSMDPKEQLEAVRNMRKDGLVMIGNFHSHPETPSRPSEEDKRLAHDSRSLYLILSLSKPDEPVLKAFSIVDHSRVSEEEILILSPRRQSNFIRQRSNYPVES